MRTTILLTLLGLLPLVSRAQDNLERDVYYFSAAPGVRRVGMVWQSGNTVVVKDREGKRRYELDEIDAYLSGGQRYKKVTGYRPGANQPTIAVMHLLDSGQVVLYELFVSGTQYNKYRDRMYYFLQHGEAPAQELPHHGALSIGKKAAKRPVTRPGRIH